MVSSLQTVHLNPRRGHVATRYPCLGGAFPTWLVLNPHLVAHLLDISEGKWLHPNTSITLPETNMAPENQWLEDELPFGKMNFLLVPARDRNHRNR